MNAISSLEQISTRLLNTGADQPGALFGIVDELYHLLIDTASLDLDNDSSREDIASSSGKALGTTWAAMCIKDFLRTKKFTDGIFAAVNDKLKEKQLPVHILYAGTGPFATLVLPLITRFDSKQVQFSFLEINERSYDLLRNIVTHFEMEDYIRRIENIDATSCKLPLKEKVAIFLSETMQPALTKEPQVSIAMNIIPQLQEETILIPGSIILTACLTNPAERLKEKLDGLSPDASTLFLKEIFSLDKKRIESFQSTGFPKTELIIPWESIGLFPQLEIMTRISVYDQIFLEQDECYLTTPLHVKDLREYDSAVRVVFQYETGKNPGIRVDISKMD